MPDLNIYQRDIHVDVEMAGPPGAVGPGVAAGGTTSQVLSKKSGVNYDTEWKTLTKTDVGLDLVDNTSDLSKPVSTAQQAALDLKLNKTDQFIYAKDYGIVGDGVTDDRAALISALDAANTANKSLFIPPNSNLYISAEIYRTYMPKLWAYPGTVTITSGHLTGVTLNFGTTAYGTSVNLTSDALRNATALQVPTTGFAAEDIILITSNTTDNGTAYAQTVRIATIDSASQMTLKEPVYQDFLASATARIRPIPVSTIGGYIRGLKFKNNNPLNTAGFVRIYYGQNVDIDIEGEGAGSAGVTVEGCYNFRVRHIATRYYDVANTGVTGQFGYGVNVSGANAHGTVDVIADYVRHAISFNGTANDVRVTGVAHSTTSTAWDAHQGSVNIVFDNCQAYGCADFAFQLRGKRQHINSGIADQCFGGVFVFDSPGENTIKNMRISNLRDNADGNRGNGIVVSKTMTGLDISNNSFYNIPRSALSFRAGTISDLVVSNNNATNVGLSLVANERNFIRGLSAANFSRARIYGNTTGDNQGSPSLQYGIQLAGTTSSDISIFNNAFHNISFGNVFNGAGTASGVAKIGRNFINNQVVDRVTDVTFSATPAFDASSSAIQRITLTANVTTSTITNPTEGQVLQLIIVQDTTGGYTFAWPSNVAFQGATPSLNATANATSIYSFTYNATTTKWTSNTPATTIGYTPEDVANKSTSTALGASNTLYPSQNAVKTYVDAGDATALHLTGDETATGTKIFSTKAIAGAVGDPQAAAFFEAQDTLGINRKTADQNGPVINLLKRGTTGDATSAVISAAGIGSLNGYGWNGTGYTRQADIDFSATENWSSTARGTRIEGFVTSNTTTARVQAFRFDQDRSAAFYGTTKPNATGTLDLGQTNLRWNNGYINKVFVAVGTSTTYVNPGGSLFSYTADAGNGTTVETDLYTDSIPANALGTNKDKIQARYGGIFVSSGTATRQLKCYFAGTAIFDSGALSISLSANWDLEVLLIRVSSTVVRYAAKLNTSGASAGVYTNVGELTGLTLSGGNILKLTGQAAGVGAATNDIVAKLGNIEWKGAP